MWKSDKQDGKRPMGEEMEVEDSNSNSTPTRQETAEDVSAFVGKGVEFKGTISYNGTVRIDGFLDGEIHTEGVLLVGEEAVITAKVTAGTIVCKGKITGDVVAKEKVKLRAPAIVSGGIKTPMLSIEEGVLFNGTLEMSQGIREVPRDIPAHPVGMSNQGGLKRVNG
ncbi:MAG: polymer-forming cytoskeletal protein [Nitrospira sp.]|jgi:cytoskeletal protein CcmA (bactofilin family)|nr:polymer-forming cytoskeletal protein [Nitrospira sp.]